MVNTVDDEEDLKEDLKEQKNSEGSESSGDFDGLEYLWDLKDFDP